MSLLTITFALLAGGLGPPPSTDVHQTVPEATVALGDAIVLRPGATCLERDRLVAQIRTWIEIDRIDARLVVEVVGDGSDPRRLAFSLRRGDDVIAVRRFDPAPARCADLHSVVGLAIALAIDATLLENLQREPDPEPPDREPVDPEPEPEPEPSPRPPQPPVGPVTAPPGPRPRPKPRQWSLWSEVVGVFSVGAPPGVGGGARFGLYGRWKELVDVGAGALVHSSGAERVGEGSAVLSVAAGRFDVCAGPRLGRVRLRGCTGLVAGAALAAGRGFDEDSTTRVPWVAVPIGARLEARIAERLSFLFGVEGQAAVIRPNFEAADLADRRSSRRFAPFAGTLELGLAILLW